MKANNSKNSQQLNKGLIKDSSLSLCLRCKDLACKMGRDLRKPVFGGLRTTQAQIRLRRRRPACASAQSDQRLCYSLIVKYHIQAWYKRNFNFLASLCGWTGWFESHYVGNPEDKFSRVAAQIYLNPLVPKIWPVKYNLPGFPQALEIMENLENH